MPIAATTELPVPTLAAARPRPRRRGQRRRISPQAGHALEILGHAIEYLTDEYIYSGGTFCSRDPRLQAIQTLMAFNRQIYFECPEVPSLQERFLAFMHLHAA